VKAAHYSVVAFPKLDNEALIQRLRDGYPSWDYALRPYIPLVSPVVPATLDELQGFTECIGRIRRGVHAFAITLYHAVERGDGLMLAVAQGRDELKSLHNEIHGGEPLAIAETGEYTPDLWLGRIPDSAERARALAEVNGLGKTVGVVDSLTMLRYLTDGEPALVLTMPFGVGRVDYHDRFPA
jgi:hypothetical protein